MNFRELISTATGGMTLYHFAASFVIYSMLGWLVESIYMSICEKRIVNRGFARGPFCPIYGFGATIGCIFLAPLSARFLPLYITGAVSATIFEYLVGRLMIKFLGSLWWDYNEKPYNFQGIICLESTLAWGFYGIVIVGFFNPWLLRFIENSDHVKMTRFVEIVLAIAVVDYIIRFAGLFKEPLLRARNSAVEAYRNFRGRWN